MASLVIHKSFSKTTKENENGISQQIPRMDQNVSCVFIRQVGDQAGSCCIRPDADTRIIKKNTNF